MGVQANTTQLQTLQVPQIELAGETTSSASSRKSHDSITRATEIPLDALPVVPTPGVAALTATAARVAAESTPEPPVSTIPLLPTSRAIIVIIQICGMLFFSSFCNGIIVVGLPSMQHELGLQEGLLVWPTSSYYLTAGSCLLLAGSVADVVGTKRVNLAGSLLAAVFALGCGLARTEGQLIGFRAVQGIANAIITPSSISIISTNVREGRPRNMGFASMGFTQPLGFCFGLVLGGVFIDMVGWRPAFYLAAAASIALVVVGVWALPRDLVKDTRSVSIRKRLASEIDWTGVTLASAGLAMLSYVLASLSADINEIRNVPSIVLLVLSGFSIPAFVLWMHYQVKNNRTALIPNSVWRNHVFTSSCLMVLFTNALTNCMELYSSLFFQSVQGNSALQASIRLLPSFVAGVAASISTGIFVHRMPVMWTVLISCVASAGAPLLMALVPIDQIYWKNAFFGQILTPIACDLLFTVGLLIISDNFPKHMQALGGAVFNTCAQLGVAIGLSVTQVIASAVTNDSAFENKSSPEALMKGYRVSFWIMFGWMIFSCVVCIVGLRRVGTIGAKRD